MLTLVVHPIKIALSLVLDFQSPPLTNKRMPLRAPSRKIRWHYLVPNRCTSADGVCLASTFKATAEPGCGPGVLRGCALRRNCRRYRGLVFLLSKLSPTFPSLITDTHLAETSPPTSIHTIHSTLCCVTGPSLGTNCALRPNHILVALFGASHSTSLHANGGCC
jgi:hypothetical protein